MKKYTINQMYLFIVRPYQVCDSTSFELKHIPPHSSNSILASYQDAFLLVEPFFEAKVFSEILLMSYQYKFRYFM